jgi:hypothetical protein
MLIRIVTTRSVLGNIASPSPSGQGYHWNSNTETRYLIGEAMGEAMKPLSAK